MKQQKNLLLVMLIISVFVFITAISSLYVEMNILSGKACNCAIPLWLFVPLLGSLGLFIGALTYSLLKPGEATKIESSHDPEALKNIILKFVPSPEEKEVVRILLERKEVKQHELSKLTNLDKVKLHTTFKKLESQGAITKEKIGKMYAVRLCEEIFK
jgi:competence protein ComGC